jgi:CRISPR-associated protein Cas5t
MICLYLQAPFGVFRTFTSGSFRPTAGFVTPSAAYGLLLNAAGIEMRRDDGASPMTLISKGLPPLKLALGAIEWPTRHSIFQQLHNYPVGSTGKEHAPNTKGSKYNIVPARREFLADVKGYICADGDRGLESQILEGLRGERPRAYGLPFLGDNNFLPDRLEPITEPLPAYWMERVPDGEEEMRDNVMRLTITIDRMDLSRSKSVLFAPSKDKGLSPTPKSWVEVNYR